MNILFTILTLFTSWSNLPSKIRARFLEQSLVNFYVSEQGFSPTYECPLESELHKIRQRMQERGLTNDGFIY